MSATKEVRYTMIFNEKKSLFAGTTTAMTEGRLHHETLTVKRSSFAVMSAKEDAEATGNGRRSLSASILARLLQLLLTVLHHLWKRHQSTLRLYIARSSTNAI